MRSEQLESLAGRRFGKLLALSALPRTNFRKQQEWKCLCDCGREHVVVRQSLRSGASKSCGCAGSRATIGDRVRTHGRTRTPLWNTWIGMRQRCEDANFKGWANYGGRGIRICDRWREFQNFEADMAPTYKKGLTIERDDVNGHYEPANCRWIPMAEQSKNRRTVRRLETPWGIMCAADAARKIGVTSSTFRERLDKGWTGDRLYGPKERDWPSCRI